MNASAKLSGGEITEKTRCLIPNLRKLNEIYNASIAFSMGKVARLFY